MDMCGYADRMVGGKGVQAHKRRKKLEELLALKKDGKYKEPKSDPVAFTKNLFRAAANFFMRRNTNMRRSGRA